MHSGLLFYGFLHLRITVFHYRREREKGKRNGCIVESFVLYLWFFVCVSCCVVIIDDDMIVDIRNSISVSITLSLVLVSIYVYGAK